MYLDRRDAWFARLAESVDIQNPTMAVCWGDFLTSVTEHLFRRPVESGSGSGGRAYAALDAYSQRSDAQGMHGKAQRSFRQSGEVIVVPSDPDPRGHSIRLRR